MVVGERSEAKSGVKKNILKNVLILSFAFMVQFTADHGATNLQSSINAGKGLGTASLASQYVGVLFSSFFLPVVIIKWLGTKWAMTFLFLLYIPYIVAQLWPSFYTLIPTGFLVGLAGAPLWCSMCTYIATVSKAHSKVSGTSADALIARFLGLFFMIFHINQVWGNLISSLVLSTADNIAAVTTVNATMIPVLCGANFLPTADAGKALQPQPPEKIQMLVGIYLACMVGAALIVAVGVDCTKKYSLLLDGRSESVASGLGLLVVTAKLMIEPNQLLLMLISIFVGLQQAFVAADFTVAYVSCVIGPGTVGYVMMAHGLADAFGCAVTGYLAKVLGRVRLICCAIVVNMCLFLTFLLWKPQPDLVSVVYVLAVVAGICNSVWLVQINAYYGILFSGREEAAFSNFRLFEAIGYVIVYSLSPYLRTSEKTYLLLSAMVLGSTGYFIVEYRESQRKRQIQIKEPKPDDGVENDGFQEC